MPRPWSKTQVPTRAAWLAWACLHAASLYAAPAAPPEPYPPGLSLPWRTIGIDEAISGASRKALTSSEAVLANSWLTAPQPLTKVLAKHPTTRNNRLITDRILAGQIQGGGAAGAGTAASLSVEPSWCSLMDHELFFVTVTDTARNTLLGSAHSAMTRSAWKKLGVAGQGAYLSSTLPSLSRLALAAAKDRPTSVQDALHIGLSLGRELSRGDEGSGLCLNQLLEEQLAPSYQVARTLGTDHQALLSDLLGRPVKLLRPTRVLVLTWQHQPEEPFKRTLPVQLSVVGNLAEGVFGKHIPFSYKATWSCQEESKAAGPSVNCTSDGSLEKLLQGERAALRLSDWPQVARRDRAWVYLDRGRAWGLKMNDRMSAEVDGQIVKGHVVHFFGPEAKLTSPRGFPINEGAVLYIRLGQQLPKVGTIFHSDPRTFPTPYPLVPSAK